MSLEQCSLPVHCDGWMSKDLVEPYCHDGKIQGQINRNQEDRDSDRFFKPFQKYCRERREQNEGDRLFDDEEIADAQGRKDSQRCGRWRRLRKA